MNKEQLRRLTDEFHAKRESATAAHIATEREKILKDADAAMKTAANSGQTTAVVWTVSEFSEHLLEIPSSPAEEDGEYDVLGRAATRQGLENLDVSRLRGALAELRDKLQADGFYLSLKGRVEGHTCRSAHWVWDLVASWR